MDFLDEFDKRAKEAKPENDGEHDDLLDFADRIRATHALPTAGERERVFKRLKASGHATAKSGAQRSSFSIARVSAMAAMVALVLCAVYLSVLGTPPPPPHESATAQPQLLATQLALALAPREASGRDEFADAQFPAAILASGTAAQPSGVEVAKAGEPPIRALRVHGLAVYQAQGETRWHVLKRGQAVQIGDTLRASLRLESGTRLLAPDGSAVSIGPGAILRCTGPRAWSLDEGAAQFEVASRPDLSKFVASTPDGTATALGTQFVLDVSRRNVNEPKKDATRCTVVEGRVQVAARNVQTQILTANQSAFLNSTGVVTAESSSREAWLAALENEMNSDRGIGQLVAKTEKANEHLPLEIASHSVSVACVDQVARTSVDEVFTNNTDRRLEGTFYYPLPSDAAISEFAMYVDGKRIVGEVLEQQKARQVFEYIVRQQKDPALLEWAGGNIFKMRVYPIEPHSQKRIQLGYTQILPRRNGTVTYTYPLYSEMLLKNPLQNLSIEFRVLSNAGLSELVSPTHVVGTALDADGKRGTLAFRAQKYSPTRDFSVTYKVPDGVECIASANAHPDDDDPYFMLQLCPKADLPARKPPARLLVIVDGSASAGAQDYAVATEFAASCADVSSNWQYGLLRGGQNVQAFNLPGQTTFTYPDAAASGAARDFLAGQPALGATDLLGTFAKAAELAADGKGLQIVYVGDGIDTLNELSGPALVEKVAAMFTGKNVNLSTVAVGSSYEGPVLQGLAAALGGTFTHVEGAADVHAAVDQIFDGFYRPQFWNARVTIEGVEPADVHPDEIGTLAAGDTAIVLGRYKSMATKIDAVVAFQVRAIFRAETDGGKFERVYPLQFVLAPDRNAFIPRLWARAHNEALLAQMGLGAPADDARIKNAVTAASVKFQIMSPYTSFLVLESEEDYARYGIKRTMKRVDWMGGAPAGQTRGLARNAGNHWGFRGGLGLDVNDMNQGLGEPTNQRGNDSFFAGLPSGTVLASDYDGFITLATDALSVAGKPNSGALNSLGYEFDTSEVESESVLFEGKKALRLDLADMEAEGRYTWGEPSEPSQQLFDLDAGFQKSEGFIGGRQLYARSGRMKDRGDAYDFDGMAGEGIYSNFNSFGRYRGYSPYQYFASTVFPNGTRVNLGTAPAAKFEYTPDQPLKGSAYYQRMAARQADAFAARMNWVLSLEAEESYARARKELEPLLAVFPKSVELKLELGMLMIRNGATTPGIAALDGALTKADEKTKAATADRIAAVLAAAGQYAAAAQRYAELARTAATGDEALRLAVLATSNWQSAATPEKCAPFREEMLKRWPENPAVNCNAGQWLLQHAPKDERGMNLLRKAAPASTAFETQYVGALIRAGQHDEALAEARRVLDGSTDQLTTYSVLTVLAQLHGVATAESKRLLSGAFNSGQYAGVAQYWSSYSVKGDREFTKLLADGLSHPGVSNYARTFAACNFANYNAAGMTVEKLLDTVKPLAAEYKTDEEFTAAYSVVTLPRQTAKNALALEWIQAVLRNPALKDPRRLDFLNSEFDALSALHREGEFFERHAAGFFTDNPTADEKGLEWAMRWKLAYMQTKNDVDGAAERLAWFSKRFPESPALPEFNARVQRLATALKKPEERDAAIDRLAEAYPENAAFGSLRARNLAQKNKFREAADAVRASLKAAPVAPRAAETKAALLTLLAQLSARDSDMRAAFLKEADERSKTQDPVQLEWTEAALTCLHAAGDLEQYAAVLFSRTLLAPADPEWMPRLGSALLEMKKYKEALVVFEALSNASPDDAGQAFKCQQIALKLKDEKAAQSWFDRAFEALAAQPNKLLQFAGNIQNSNPEWALKAYARLEKDPVHFPLNSIALQAANIARNAGRTDEAIDWYFKALLAPDSYYVSAASAELTNIAQQEAEFRVIEPRARAVLDGNPGASQAVGAHVLLAKLKRLKQDAAGARAEIEAALKFHLSVQGYNYTGAALLEVLSAESMGDQMEQYALTGGGELDVSTRGQLIRNAINYTHNDYPRVIRLYRALLKGEYGNEDEDRRQLVVRLVRNNQLDEAVVELRKIDFADNSYGNWSAWDQLVSAYENRHDSETAFTYAQEMWAKMKDDQSYGTNALRKFADVAFQANRARRLDPARLKQVVEAYRYFAQPYFDGAEQYRYQLDNIAKHVDAFGLRGEFDALAQQADASGDVRRILAAARYLSEVHDDAGARRRFEHALEVEPNNREALQGIYDIAVNRVNDWAAALRMLDALESQQGTDQVWLKTERIRCLHGLQRMEDARKTFHELIQVPQFIRNGYWNMQTLAQECEKAKDFPLAIEVWELAIRGMRAQNGGHPDMSYAARFYTACARAYAQNGDDAKALDCLLRGMSLIPRNESYYKTVLQAALDTVLKGKSLAQVVAAHENNVKADGNDKPHLRIAFAEAYKKEHKTREMLEQLRYAADLLPKDMSLRKEVIDGYITLKDNDAAIDEYRRWSALDPQNIDLYRGWGDLYESLGRRADALLAWATMAEVRPREAEGYRAYAERLVTAGEHGKAASAFRQAVKYRPTEFSTARELADEYMRTLPIADGNARIVKLWADGAAACRKAMEDVPDDPQPWLNLGRFLDAQRKPQEARELYEKIIMRSWPRFQRETVDEARRRLKL